MFCPLVDGNIVMLLLAFLDVNMLCNNKINKCHDDRSVTVGKLETILTSKQLGPPLQSKNQRSRMTCTGKRKHYTLFAEIYV